MLLILQLTNLESFIIFYISIQSLYHHQNMSNSLTEQQLRQRRRQKILARAAAPTQQQTQQNDASTPNTTLNTNTNTNTSITRSTQSWKQSQKSSDGNESTKSPFQIFKTTQYYQKMKRTMEYISIGLGFVSAAIALTTDLGINVFIICLLLVISCTIAIQTSRSQSLKNLPKDNLATQLQSIKQLQIVNKVLKFQSAISPITKLFASYFLCIVLWNCLFNQKHSATVTESDVINTGLQDY